MDYHDKYLKYKEKYLKLKNGGAHVVSNTQWINYTDPKVPDKDVKENWYKIKKSLNYNHPSGMKFNQENTEEFNHGITTYYKYSNSKIYFIMHSVQAQNNPYRYYCFKFFYLDNKFYNYDIDDNKKILIDKLGITNDIPQCPPLPHNVGKIKLNKYCNYNMFICE